MQPGEKQTAKRYVLTVLRDNGQYVPMTNEEMDKFEREHPDLARFWQDPGSLDQLSLPKVPETMPLYESWDKAAKRLLQNLWKFSQSWIFHEPVDPEKLGIPDYFEVVKKPMDLGTVKSKLNNNVYMGSGGGGAREFKDDVELVFENCLLFNGEDSSVGKMCKNVKDEYKRIFDQINFGFYLE